MIRDWDYLAYSAEPAEEALNELRAWLRSQTTDSATLFTRTTFPLFLLQPALSAATSEIRNNLDLQVTRLVQEAAECNMQVAESDYYASRAEDWNGMQEEEIYGMNEEVCIQMLWKAKDEVAWLVNEISRLECYVAVEKQMKSQGEEGRRAVLWPAKRNAR